jgi:hypothetical protein
MVPASYSGTSIALDDGGGSSGGDLELNSKAATQLELTAKPQPGAVAALKAAAEKKAAAARKAAARRAAARAAKIAAENTPISSAQWGRVIRNPDNYIGDIYTISGTVAEYNLNSNTIATVAGNDALVATDANGNDFIVEADPSKLGNVQPGQTFTAKVTVLGVVQVETRSPAALARLPISRPRPSPSPAD